MNKNNGVSLAMVIALAKKYAMQYGALGITNITAASPNIIRFTLDGGQSYDIAVSLNASGVTFDNSNTTIQSTNVQDALVELFEMMETQKNSISSFSLTEGQETILYDTTDGITVSANGKITRKDGTEETFETEYNLPIVGGDGVLIDASLQNDKIVIKTTSSQIPLATTAQNGKVLGVVNGAYDFVDNASGTVTQGLVKTLTYDNTTLSEHITEIMSYANTENGGTLLNIGFKIGENAVVGDITNLEFSLESGAPSTPSTISSQPILGAGGFVYAIPQTIFDTNPKTLIFYCGSAFSQGTATLTLVDATTKEATLSGKVFVLDSTSIMEEYFQNINLLEVQLEHLVINYHS